MDTGTVCANLLGCSIFVFFFVVCDTHKRRGVAHHRSRTEERRAKNSDVSFGLHMFVRREKKGKKKKKKKKNHKENDRFLTCFFVDLL